MRSILLLLLLSACANANVNGEASRIANPSCVLLCFDRHPPPEPLNATPK